jgi:methionyl-tRNA synthetase
MNNFYITTPIYYVNGPAHIGHAYTNIIADVIARFKRLDSKNVMFLTGTDEHGQKIFRSAEKQNLTPQEFVDNIVPNFKYLWEKMGCTYDYFIRTTDVSHKEFVRGIWQQMINKGYIYLGKYSGWYAVRDEAFYAESELVDGKAPTGADVEWIEEPSYFFKLSAFQEKLLQFFDDNPDFVVPNYRFNEVKAFVKGGLRDISVSRISVQWGIKVPNNTQHTIYVWLDALFNYLSALHTNDKNDFWPCDVHVIGKDILTFHAVYWPAFLMSLDIQPPKQILAHGWWKNEGEKMSKSLGNVLDPNDIIDEFSPDYMRYFMLREMQIGQDGNFSTNALMQRINGELVNNIGNLVQRVVSFAYKNCHGIVPEGNDFTDEDTDLLNHCHNAIDNIRELIDNYKINDALNIILELGHNANAYVEQNAPWKLKTENSKRMQTVIFTLLENIRVISILLQPFIPDGALKILNTIYKSGKDIPFADIKGSNISGSSLNPIDQVFRKFEI